MARTAEALVNARRRRRPLPPPDQTDPHHSGDETSGHSIKVYSAVCPTAESPANMTHWSRFRDQSPWDEKVVITVCMDFPNAIWVHKSPTEVILKTLLMLPITV
ncbi:hypothetical protein Hamer_G015746, partial [Homarus americanus]